MATIRPYPAYPGLLDSEDPRWAQTAAILNEYNPLPAFWRLMNSDMAQGAQITDQNIADGWNVAGSVMGGSAMIPAEANSLRMGIKAFHGSPHSFDKFEWSPRTYGTGEGAQAYGHGLYFSESEDVARNYRDVLTNRAPNHIETQLISNGVSKDAANTYARWASETKGGRGSVDAFEAAMREKSPSPTVNSFRQKVLDEMPKIREATGKIGGSMYEVSINADPNSFLDWDKPLSEQPQFLELLKKSKSPKIREIANDPKLLENMQSYGRDLGPMTGKELYNRISIMASGKTVGPEATPYLAKAGIPGIKFLDAGSRGAGDGTRNYVVFDDSLIDIIRKYGIAGLLGAGGLYGMSDNQAQAGER